MPDTVMNPITVDADPTGEPDRGYSVTWNLKFLRGSVAKVESDGVCETAIFSP
jgi:hypothetical protein